MAALELQGLGKRFGALAAVADLSLQIGSGEFVALLGPSGCGKTTTLQMIAGFTEPTAGDIRVDGRSIVGMPPHRRNIGVVFQSYALFPHLTVFENVAFGLRMRGVQESELARRVRAALDMVRLEAMHGRIPRELSGGQQQRVALARALVIEPALLLLDEPLSNLDAQLREQMRFEIRQIQRQVAITTVFVTHDQGEAMAAADRLVIMRGGRMCQVGTAREIYEQPASVFVAGFIGQANMFRGTLAESGGGNGRLEGAVGTLIGRLPRTLPIGAEVTLAVRPEDMHLAATAAPGQNACAASVLGVSYLGGTVAVTLRAGDTTLTLQPPRNAALPEEGAACFVTWPHQAGLLLEDSA